MAFAILVGLTKSDIRRFWNKIDKQGPNGCWIWKGGHTEGYGQFRLRTRSITAHRISWLIHKGTIPKGMCVLHNCPGGDNRECVNPDHLWLGTRGDNNRDCCVKGDSGPHNHPERMRRGEGCAFAVLTEEKVKEARGLRLRGWIFPRIASHFGVSVTAVSLAVKRKTWRHVK